MTQAFIFDLDGVIIDSIPLWSESELIILKRKPLKVPLDFEAYAKQMRFRYSYMMSELKEQHDIKDPIEKLRIERANIIKNLYRRKLKLMPGFLTLVKRLRKQGYKLAIGTSTPPVIFSYVLQKFKLRQYFDYHLASMEINSHKPEPDVFIAVAQKLKIQPKECIVIEDSEHGILAAKRAGMRCIALRHPYTNAGDLKKADVVVK